MILTVPFLFRLGYTRILPPPCGDRGDALTRAAGVVALIQG